MRVAMLLISGILCGGVSGAMLFVVVLSKWQIKYQMIVNGETFPIAMGVIFWLGLICGSIAIISAVKELDEKWKKES